MKTVVELISVENTVFNTFAAWSSMLVIKMVLMSFLTALARVRTKKRSTPTAANPEDLVVVGASELSGRNEDVERVRRAHRNDMENILPYLSVGLFYVLTDPQPMLATILFRVATVARFLHTFVYAIYVIPQPARAITFGIHMFITLYMAIMCVIYFI